MTINFLRFRNAFLLIALVLSLASCNEDAGFFGNGSGFSPNPGGPGNPTPTPTPAGNTLSIEGPFANPEQPVGTLSGTAALDFHVTGEGNLSVELFLNGQSVGTDNTSPFSFSVDTVSLSGPTVEVLATVRDSTGQSASTAAVTYTLDNAGPLVAGFSATPLSPVGPGGEVSGLVQLEAQASDASGISQVDFQVDGVSVGKVLQEPFSLTWDSSTTTDGSHTLTAVVSDGTASGNPVTAGPITLNLLNQPAAATAIVFVSPHAGDRLSGQVAVKIQATDADGIQTLTLLMPAALTDINPDPAIFEALFDTTQAPEGPFTLQAQAVDSLGNIKVQDLPVFIDNVTLDGSLTIPNPDPTGDFGAEVAWISDSNDDGGLDLAVGSPSTNTVYVLRKLITGIPEVVSIANPEPESAAQFGFSITGLGDINGDGFGDLAVGAPGASVNGKVDTGKVFLFYGPDFSTHTLLPHIQPQATERFGRTLEGTGDLNGDGVRDLLVSAPSFSTPSTENAGRIEIFLGPTFSTSLKIAAPVAQENAHFGQALAVLGDFDGDGKDDFAVGTPLFDKNGESHAGRVDIYKQTTVHHKTLFDLDIKGENNFGEALAGRGDLNKDGKPDLIIGVPGTGGGGKIFYTLAPNFTVVSSQRKTLSLGKAGPNFGAALSSPGDIDGDGTADFVVGVPGLGEVVLYFGPAYSKTLVLKPAVNPASTAFGSSISGGDFSGDGLADLAIGAPKVAPSGGVSIYFNH